MEKGTTIRDSTINIPIDIDREAVNKFIGWINKESKNSELQHNEIRILLEQILKVLKHKK